MEKRAIKVVNCDVFCIGDFAIYDDIVITGNFYAEGNVLVASLEAGEDIIINAPEYVSADTILSFGTVSMCSPVVDSVYVHAESGCSIFSSPREPYSVLQIKIYDSDEYAEEYEREVDNNNEDENNEEEDYICPHCLLDGNCNNCPCGLDLCDGNCDNCNFKKFVCNCHDDCETCEYRTGLEDLDLFDDDNYDDE